MKQQVTLGKRAMQLVLCATVAGAALTAQTAYAGVVVVDFSANPLSAVPYNIDGFYLNIITGATGTSGSGTPGWDLNPYFSSAGTASAGFRFFTPTGGGMVGASGIVAPLANGAVIGAASTFITGVTNANAATSGTNIFGFRFVNETITPSPTYYGYVVVQQTANPPIAGSVKVLSYAYENTGASITVSAVPEPTSAMLMLGGLLAAGAWRQMARRREAA